MRWLRRRRDLGAVDDAVFVNVHGPGETVHKHIMPGRVAVTFEDTSGRVIVEADTASMLAMLDRARQEVEAVAARQRAAYDRAITRLASRNPNLLADQGNALVPWTGDPQ